MIRLFKGVLVIRIFRNKSQNRQVELCIFPPFKSIPMHIHEYEDIELMHVFGKALYRIKKRGRSILYGATTRKDFLNLFTINANEPHGAIIGWTGLVTLSIQKWKKDMDSVTKDFKEVI